MKKLATAGGAVQLRSVALNVAFIFITKKVQGLDATGTAAAAHAVTIQLWQVRVNLEVSVCPTLNRVLTLIPARSPTPNYL